jgi:glutaredoxin
MVEIIVYSTPTCPRCKLLISELQKAGLPCSEKEFTPEVMAECACCTGVSTREAPVVQIGSIWIFANDLFDRNGQLLSGWRRIFG